MTAALWLLPLLPATVGGLLLVWGRRADRVAGPLAILVSAVAVALAATVAVGRPRVSAPFLLGIPAELAVDGLSTVLVLTVTIVTLAVLLVSLGEFGPHEARARFHGLMLLFAGAMLLTVTATNLGILLVSWEIMGATSYALIGYWWREPFRMRAAFSAFVTTRGADLGLYLAAGAALAGAGSLSFDQLPDASSGWRSAITAGVALAALGKSAQLPFSYWLSGAMAGPSPVSALLHSATMVAAGSYLMLRLSPLLEASGWGAPTVAWVGALTALFVGAVAVAQRDLKQLLAASTVAQMGFIILAAGAGGITAGTMHLVAHAATKSLLFLVAGVWLEAFGTKDLLGLRGVARRFPLVGATFAAGALSLAGIPPFALWVTKDEILTAALERSLPLYLVGLAGGVLSAAYSVKALAYVTRPLRSDAEAGYDTEQRGTRHIPAVSKPALVFLAVGATVLGAQGLPPVAEAYERLLGTTGEPRSGWAELALSGGLAVLTGALVARWVGRPAPIPAALAGWLARWMDLEALVNRTIVVPTMVLARALARFDDRVVDRFMVADTAAGTRLLATASARLDDASVDGVVRAIGRATLRLGRAARLPQTGLLHQYYAQAVVGLAVLALLLLVVR